MLVSITPLLKALYGFLVTIGAFKIAFSSLASVSWKWTLYKVQHEVAKVFELPEADVASMPSSYEGWILASPARQIRTAHYLQVRRTNKAYRRSPYAATFMVERMLDPHYQRRERYFDVLLTRRDDCEQRINAIRDAYECRMLEVRESMLGRFERLVEERARLRPLSWMLRQMVLRALRWLSLGLYRLPADVLQEMQRQRELRRQLPELKREIHQQLQLLRKDYATQLRQAIDAFKRVEIVLRTEAQAFASDLGSIKLTVECGRTLCKLSLDEAASVRQRLQLEHWPEIDFGTSAEDRQRGNAALYQWLRTQLPTSQAIHPEDGIEDLGERLLRHHLVLSGEIDPDILQQFAAPGAEGTVGGRWLAQDPLAMLFVSDEKSKQNTKGTQW